MTEGCELTGVGERLKFFDVPMVFICSLGYIIIPLIAADQLWPSLWAIPFWVGSLIAIAMTVFFIVRASRLRGVLGRDSLYIKSWLRDIQVEKNDIIAIELTYYRGWLDMYSIGNRAKAEVSPYVVVLVTREGYVPLFAAVAEQPIVEQQADQIKFWTGRDIPIIAQRGRYAGALEKRPGWAGFGFAFMLLFAVGASLRMNTDISVTGWFIGDTVILGEIMIAIAFIVLVWGAVKLYRDYAHRRSMVPEGSPVDYVEGFDSRHYESQ